ncbi:MAG: DUF5011 domain-containing protein [Clostridia bacterium]|nr:DUF5011 domain-containing protein [Clostridia bacterium]
MKNKIIRILIAASLICAVLLLSGCGGDVSSSNTGETRIPEAEDIAFETIDTHPDEPDDTEPPFFLTFNYNVTLEQGDEFDIHKYVSYIDNVDREVELIVDGDVDVNSLGEYPLKLTVKDDSGNSSFAKMTVKVVEPVTPAPSGGTSGQVPELPKNYSKFVETYKKDGAMVGIDVSRWQGDIDFYEVASAGAEFVIIRIGGFSDELFEDAYYANNINNAKEAGLKVGVYWYSEEDGADAVRRHADYLYSLLDGKELDFPIFFDWEDYADFENYKMNVRDLNEMFLAFKEEAEARGYTASLYNSKYYLGLLWSDEVKDGGVWLAHYIEKTTYDGKYFLWQQGYGRIEGIDGDVDLDVFYPDALK